MFEICEVRRHKDEKRFEREVEGLLEMCRLMAQCRDKVAREAILFMPEFDKDVVKEALSRIRV